MNAPAHPALSQEEAFARIRLLRSPNIGPVSYAMLLQRFGAATEALEALPDLGKRGGRQYRAIPAEKVEREVESVRKGGAKYLFHDQPGYPALLGEIEGAPPILTWRGELSLAARPCVAIVGARNASAAAVKLAREFAKGLAEAGLTVVSGLARGIDGAAHEGAFPHTTGVIASGIDIAVAFDLSGSMLAEDFKLKGKRANRTEVAKAVLKGFVEDRPSDRIGLVAFAGRAYIAAPLTLDHDFLIANLDRLEAGSQSIEDGTAIGSAISAGLNRLRDLPNSESGIIILMTDGQNNAGTVAPLTAAEAAESLGVKVYTIGVGTRGVAPMPYTDVFGRKRYRNVEVNIDEETLQKIAEQTGGQYFRADSQKKLREIYDKIDEMEKTEVEVERYFNYDEWFPFLVVAGLALLLLELILANTVWLKLP